MTATIEFFGNLREFFKLDPHPTKTINLKDHPQLKDAIESCRVPHCEVGSVTVNGQPAQLNQRLQEHDHAQVFPIQNPQAETFAIDCNVGKLNALLRSLGFDCFYENDISDKRISEIACSENRTLLTKDRRLLMRKNIILGYFVRSVMPLDQLNEVLNRFSLNSKIKLLTRCIDCNVPTQKVSKSEILHRLEPLTKKYYDEFNICPRCLKIFWRGTHYERIKDWAGTL